MKVLSCAQPVPLFQVQPKILAQGINASQNLTLDEEEVVKQGLLILLLLTSIILFARAKTPEPMVSATATTYLRVNPSNVSANLLSSFSISIVIENVTDMAGYELRLLWDTSILNCTQWNYSSNAWVTDPSTPPWTNFFEGKKNVTVMNDGKTRFWLSVNYGMFEPKTGTYVIATLSFKAVGIGSTILSMSQTESVVGDYFGNTIPITIIEGFVTSKASGTIYIRADGSVDPPATPIQRVGNAYAFTGNINGSIVVERNGILIDGNGYTLQGSGFGLYLSENVTVRNTQIKTFYYGIYLYCSSNNTISGNNIANNTYGICLYSSFNNSIYHNNFTGNNNQTYVAGDSSSNFWDNGYPSGGNYWSDYSGIDLQRDPQQNETGRDGIGDTPYSINALDKYPLMNPWHEPPWVPYASFSFSLAQATVNETVVFDAWNSYDFDGQITRYLWDFGDGSTANETSPITNHDYSFPKVYNVTLTVIDNEGISSTLTKSINTTKIASTITVAANSPTLILGQSITIRGSITPTRAKANVIILFNGSSFFGGWTWREMGPSDSPRPGDILANATTDEDGNYAYNWTPPEIGTYKLKARWSGDEYTFPSESTAISVTCTKIPTSITIATSCSTTLNGFKVEVQGKLREFYGTGLKNDIIVFSYTFAGIGTWSPITSATTDSLGEYHIFWFPQATGAFLLKAEWAGDSSHFGAANTISVSTISYESQVFAVESNSTISALSFDSANRKLTFTASGENGTKGYTRVTIAKSLLPDIALLKVNVDGVKYDRTMTETSDSWVLSFTYNHSSHFIEVSLGSTTANLLPFLLLSLLAIVTLVLGVLLVWRRRRKGAKLQ